MRWLLACAVLLACTLALFIVPARLEGPVLVPISPGHGLSLLDMLALAPLLVQWHCSGPVCGTAGNA